MLYEKKMLILSGDGKGVVLIEKSAGGSKFSLRTFDLRAYSEPLKIGIVTRTNVVVRDLPAGDDPAIVFSIDVGDISELHFAVFDDGLRLYGTNAKRMWESNLMDLLARHDHRPPPQADRPTPPALPPLSPKPEVLPLPDGTGIPQSRLSLYGDEAIAETDFYTPLDLSARMPVVDKFLDSPRVLDDRLAPRVEPHDMSLASAQSETEAIETVEPVLNAENEISNAAEAEQPQSINDAESVRTDAVIDRSTDSVATMPEPDEENNTATVAASELFETLPDDIEQFDDAVVTATETTQEIKARGPSENRSVASENIVEKQKPLLQPERAHVAQNSATQSNESVKSEQPDDNDVRQTSDAKSAIKVAPVDSGHAAVAEEAVALAEVAATDTVEVTSDTAEMPWEKQAIWLKKRSHRKPVVKKREVKPLRAVEQVRKLRECAFFERVRSDVETLFGGAEKDEELNKLLPDLEWVKIDFEGRRISVGRSGNLFLCYAVSGGYEKVSPLGGEAQWLPRDRNTPTGRGYWLIFQNMNTGDIIDNH